MSKYLALMEDVVEPDLSDPSSGRGRRRPRLFSETRKWETIKADWLNVPHPSLGEDPVGLYHWRDTFAADAYEGGYCHSLDDEWESEAAELWQLV